MTNQQASEASAVEAAKTTLSEYRGWFMVLGIVLVVLGLLAMVFPLMSTIAVKVFLGWLFLVSGVVQVVQSFSTQKWSGFFLNLLIGVLYVIAGGWLAFLPLSGIFTLTVLLAAMFLAQGIGEIVMAVQLKPKEGWGWILFAGIIAVLAGGLMVAQLPGSAAWAIGMLAGINMISSGWAYFFLAMAAGRK